ncbi:ubiquinone/menaquinone biosynthesis methyltransferase [Leptospira sp. GIMC2001]|uniref:ubiquinone/menaquinone biosynthesis methyltransferase n=1 Tax=Leptospira sp. GIMC2001 TaxID=1513297 RepID=UPI0023491382|nr:ubiquinone/menaquinone biosynthesis methyltransferase [Leptospira sp. GIMC2001]WCL47534.1 ubiquinone/menaquinone biosynthesis methyltransferase [Leptospira sp. GIMC2001]
MSKFTMPDQESKSSFVKENFEKIASKYDLFNDLNSGFLHKVWKNELVRYLDKQDCRIILDLCCGTGDIAYRISKLPNLEKLYAVDFAPSMLQVATNRLKDSSKSESMVGDAMNLNQFTNESLDAVTIGFGLRNVTDLRACLKEIYRVLKPGGVYLNLDVGKVRNPIIRFFADFYFFRIVPIMGYLIWGGKNSMFDYLPVSSISYPGQDELQKILEESGFVDVKYKNFVFGNAVLHISYKPKS